MAKLTKRISGNETAFPRREKAAKTPEQALPAADEFVCEE